MVIETVLHAGKDERYAPGAFDKAVGRRIPYPTAWDERRVDAFLVAATVAPDGLSCTLRLDLDPPAVDDPRAQVGAFHPDTSRQAAARALPRSGSDRRRVYDLLVERGDEGATDDEIEQALNLPHQTASARRNGLRDDGWVVDSGRTRPTRTGSPAVVWVAVR